MLQETRALVLSVVVFLVPVSIACAGPLHDAVRQGDIVSIESVIERDADLEAQDDAKLTPLILAALAGRVDVLNVLIENGANPHGRDGNGLTGLHAGAHVGEIKVVRLFLGYGLDASDQQNSFSISPLHAAAERGFVEIAASLINHGANLDLTSGTGHTALFMAALNTHPDMIRLLKANGADCGHIRAKRYRTYCETVGN
jgi:ankyrin repeat protein